MAVPTYKSKYTGEEVDARLDMIDVFEIYNTNVDSALRSQASSTYYLSDTDQLFTSILPAATTTYPLTVTTSPASFIISMSPALLIHAKDSYKLRLRLSALDSTYTYSIRVLLEDILSFDQAALLSDITCILKPDSTNEYIDIPLPVTSPTGLDYTALSNAIRVTLQIRITTGTSHTINIVADAATPTGFFINAIDTIANTLLYLDSDGTLKTQDEINARQGSFIEDQTAINEAQTELNQAQSTFNGTVGQFMTDQVGINSAQASTNSSVATILNLKQNITDESLTTASKTVPGSINELKTVSDNQTNAIGLKQDKTDNTLTTTSKTVVGGINELKTAVDTNTNNINNKQDKTDNNLTTTSKTVVGGINELKAAVDTNTNNIGNKQDKTDNSLTTTSKTVVGGINELKTTSDGHTTSITTNTNAIVLKQNITDQSLLTQAKTIVGGINELVSNGTGQGWTAGRYAPVTTNMVVDATYGAYVNYLDPTINLFEFQDNVMLLEGVYLTLVSTVAGNVVLKFYCNGVLVTTSVVPVTTTETTYTQPFVTPLTGSFYIERDYDSANDTVKTGGVPVTVVATIVRAIETPPTIGSINVPIIYECTPDATYGNAVYLSATNKYMRYATRVSNLRQARFYLVSASAVTGNIVLKAYVNGIYQADYVIAVGATPAIVLLDLPGYTGAFQWFRDTDDARDTLKDGATVTAIMISVRSVEV